VAVVTVATWVEAETTMALGTGCVSGGRIRWSAILFEAKNISRRSVRFSALLFIFRIIHFLDY
jgi:hypothetical protein